MGFPDRPRAVITGAGSGLGRALAVRLATRSARLLLSDVEREGLEETARLAREAGGDVEETTADVRRAEEVEALRDLARATYGGADILVNNAGVAVAGPVGEVSLADWQWQIDVNLWGVIHGCHVFAPDMRARGEGFILNVASAAGLLSFPEMAPYNVTKSAVVALSRSLCAELSAAGVKVGVLCPSFFRSQIHASARTTQARLGTTAERLVTRARWSAEDVARVALRGLERGRLHIVPQLDARLLWRLQRLFPGGLQWLIGVLHAADLLDRLGKRAA